MNMTVFISKKDKDDDESFSLVCVFQIILLIEPEPLYLIYLIDNYDVKGKLYR